MMLSKYALLIHAPFLTYFHNLYLEVWLQQGLIGITAWLWLIVVLYARFKSLPTIEPPNNDWG